MKLTEEDLQKLANLAIDAAVRTGKFISESQPGKVEHKGTGESLATDVVTEVDRQSQELILKILNPSLEEYDLALLTEESPDDGSRLEKDYFWCIDPIDGTLQFIEGTPGYAVSIALISKEGIPQIGVVYDPWTHTLYHAVRGGGAFRNSNPWKLPNVGNRLRIFTDRHESEGPKFKPMVKAMDAESGTYGGAVMNALWCLENPPACYFKFPTTGNLGGSFWDFAAITCIYNELDLWASDVQGHTLQLNRPEAITLSHCGVLFATDPTHAKQFIQLNANPMFA
ncbi:Inositol-1-monophosphatase [Pontiella desulfatans]|uniref:Inositol-1-monophosphatase n=1 Tax=Pontiella desulfatans TaxID=2750659 RepID=A0A6C2U1Y7_PONDE|nr:inositol monophosphatase family protein [Pontiella desulfatans]VGO13664.1 Inositol-1-monophosphatase [Pontiella desulfatans]